MSLGFAAVNADTYCCRINAVAHMAWTVPASTDRVQVTYILRVATPFSSNLESAAGLELIKATSI